MAEFQKIPWDKSVWFFDIDDTLIDTAGTTPEASEGIEKIFENKFGVEKSREVQNYFNQVFELMVAGYRVKSDQDWDKVPGGKEAFVNLQKQLEEKQTQVKKDYGVIKKWSREIFVKLAAEKAQVEVNPDIVTQAAEAYWLTLTKKTEVFPSALQLIEEIRKHQRPIYLITSSDARLKMSDEGQFFYDPKYSESLKRQRVELLRDKGIQFNAVSIGDPEDKPHLDFFQKGIKTAETNLGQTIKLSESIMIGDSFAGDLQVPKEDLGFGLVVLFEKDLSSFEFADNQLTTGNLLKTVDYLV